MWSCRPLVVLALLLCASDARAAWSVGTGVEHFAWTEDTDPITVKERGPRFALWAGFSQPLGAGFQAGLQWRPYLGDVSYDGSYLATPSVPASGTTRYQGSTLSGHLAHTLGMRFEGAVAIELDWWRRRLSSNQDEDYRVVSLRFGVEHAASTLKPWHVGAGLRTTLAIREDAHFTDLGFEQNPRLEPGASTTPYFRLGYRFARHWAVTGSYEAFDFGRSNQVLLTQGSSQSISFQPASTMQVLGLSLEYHRSAE